MLTISNAIKLMILGGLLAVAFVAVKACQAPDGPLDRFAVNSLSILTSLDSPPPQPTLSFTTPGGEITLADFRGKVVLVNVWATWCAPCVVEMPSLDELSRQRGGEDFAVVPISMDRRMADAQDFYDQTGLTDLPLIHDGTFAVSARLELPGLPTTVIYNRSGREIARVSGEADWASEEALALIDHLIGR